jgi:sarcosine oxidase
MTPEHADLIVVGGGVMGLATAWWAARDRHVVLLERFDHGHRRGASHGSERIFRYGYTDPVYVRLAQAADAQWQRLEAEAGRTLVDRIGCIDVGSDDELAAMATALGAAGVDVEWCTAEQAGARWPGIRFATPALHQPQAGRTRAAEALDALRDGAARLGADLRFDHGVQRIDADDDGVVVHTADGAVRAPVAVVTTGAWTVDLLGDTLPLPPLTTTREQVAFFQPRTPGAWPAFIDRGPTTCYGVPAPNGAMKIGEHHTGPVTTGDTRSFEIDADALARVVSYVREWLPGLDPEPVDVTTCLYTLTPTEDFVLDRVGNLVIGAGFSGHGFKFAPEIGRLLAGMAAGDPPPGRPFGIQRDADRTTGPSSHR